MRGTKLNDWGLVSSPLSPSRRGLFQLVAGTGAGLALGVMLRPALTGTPAHASAEAPVFNPFVRITPDNTVIVVVKHLDKGQGVATGLATLVAEELDADHAQMTTEFAPVNNDLYKNLAFGVMGTGGSSSMSNSWEQYRAAGAAARAMLVGAAAKRWNVAAADVKVSAGVVSSGSKTATFGELATDAAAIPVPSSPKLKDPKDYAFIGKSFARLDQVAKSTGAPIFTQDVRLPGMLTATLARPTRFGGKVRSFDATAARKVPGVVDVVETPQGVAVLATGTYAAIQGRAALKIEWDDAAAEMRSSADMLTDYLKLAESPGKVAKTQGDAQAALKSATKVIEATYTFPYLAHAPMEPMNAVIQLKDGKAQIWTGAQLPSVDQLVASQILGLKPEAVTVNTLWAGGSFGRRAVTVSDYVAEAAGIVKASGRADPIKLVWTREDDIKGGYYRPMTVHKVRVGLNAAGQITAWHHRIVGQPILLGTPFGAMVKGGIDPTVVGGVFDSPYLPANAQVEVTYPENKVPVLWWRSVENTHSAYVMETMIDEVAKAAGQDPVAYRLGLFTQHPRHTAVLKLAAEKSGWGTAKTPEGSAYGVAVHESFGSLVAQVALVRMEKSRPKVVSVTAAVDVGTPINPDNIKAQVEGAIAYGLGAALHSKITFKKGEVEQANFDGYQVLRHEECPKVEVHILPMTTKPSGIGEPGLPPIAPAVANAIAALTGQRVRDLPFDDGLKKA